MDFIFYGIRILMALVFLQAMADCWLTNAALKLPGTKEANPVMAFFQRLLGSKWVVVRLLFCLGTIYGALNAENPLIGLLTLAFNFALMSWVLWNNWSIIRQRT